MRQTIIIMGMVIIIFMSAISIISINTKSTRMDELDMAVSAAVQQTVKYSKLSGERRMNSNDDMMASFVKNLALNLNSDSNITVQFHGVDYENGLLSVTVTESFNYITGKEGKIKVRKTAIYD